jgi:hypothetical protein
MRKKISKTAALIALFAFVFLLAPGVSNARPGKFDIRLLIKQPAIWISSIWNIITPIFDGGNGPKAVVPGDSGGKIKSLTDSLSPKPSKGD